MTEVYYDTSFLFKAQVPEAGSEYVRAHAMTVDGLVCSIHGRAEFASICHRKFREGAASREHMGALLEQLRAYSAAGGIRWLPLSEDILERVEEAFRCAPANVVLRTATALHLASAAENGFKEIYSGDRHLLAAAPLFGLRGVDLVGSPSLRVVV